MVYCTCFIIVLRYHSSVFSQFPIICTLSSLFLFFYFFIFAFSPIYIVFSWFSFLSSFFVRYELRPNGEELDVTADDLHEWLDQVVWVLLVDSVVKQVGAIVKGKNLVFFCFISFEISIRKKTKQKNNNIRSRLLIIRARGVIINVVYSLYR